MFLPAFELTSKPFSNFSLMALRNAVIFVIFAIFVGFVNRKRWFYNFRRFVESLPVPHLHFFVIFR